MRFFFLLSSQPAPEEKEEEKEEPEASPEVVDTTDFMKEEAPAPFPEVGDQCSA